MISPIHIILFWIINEEDFPSLSSNTTLMLPWFFLEMDWINTFTWMYKDLLIYVLLIPGFYALFKGMTWECFPKIFRMNVRPQRKGWDKADIWGHHGPGQHSSNYSLSVLFHSRYSWGCHSLEYKMILHWNIQIIALLSALLRIVKVMLWNKQSPKCQWLETTEAYLLLMWHIHLRAAKRLCSF